MRAIIAVDEPRGGSIAHALERAGHTVVVVVDPIEVGRIGAESADAMLQNADLLLLDARRDTLTAALVAQCDAAGVRICALAAGEDGKRLAAAFGLAPALPLEDEPWRVAAGATAPASAQPESAPRTRGRVIVVWGPPGAPGRSTVAIELAMELARGGRRIGLVDADAHSPSLALALGLADEGPGFAAACRQAERQTLDAAELTRISAPIGPVQVLTGINRPGRWPELAEQRVSAALEACRDWVDDTIVDVSASLERDEEIVSDLFDGPRRNAATIAAVRAADLVVAVAAADPVGLQRFLRSYSELRATIGSTRVVVLVNKMRPGPLGIDPRGQVRRALDRFGGIRDVWFLPLDQRATDASLLQARPVAALTPRSPLTAALRRFVGEAIAPPVAPVARERRGRTRRAAKTQLVAGASPVAP